MQQQISIFSTKIENPLQKIHLPLNQQFERMTFLVILIFTIFIQMDYVAAMVRFKSMATTATTTHCIKLQKKNEYIVK